MMTCEWQITISSYISSFLR